MWQQFVANANSFEEQFSPNTKWGEILLLPLLCCRKARRRYPRCLMILLLLFQLPRLQGKNFCIVYYHMYIWLFRSKLLSERDLQFSPLDQDAFKLANYWISFLHWAAFYGGWQWRVQRGNSFSKLCLSWYLNIMTLRYQYHHYFSENKENKKVYWLSAVATSWRK